MVSRPSGCKCNSHLSILIYRTVCDGDATWFKVPSKNIKSESGAERLGPVSMHASEVRGAILDLFGTLSSL